MIVTTGQTRVLRVEAGADQSFRRCPCDANAGMLGREHQRAASGVRRVVVTAWWVVDAVLAAPRGATFQLPQLSQQGAVVE